MASAHIGQANQISFARTAQAGINIRWDGGGVLANGPRLGLGGGLLLCPTTLASRDLLEVLMAPGASEVGSASSSGGAEGTTYSSAAGAAGAGGGGGTCGTTWSSAAAAGGGGGGLLGILGSRFLGS
jgi:hypothetical protein